MNTFHKSALIGMGALMLSTLAIQASDMVRGIEGNLSGLVSESTGPCADGETQVLLGSHQLCVDIYEASAGKNCPHANPQSPIETQSNANIQECATQSKGASMPWRFVSLTQAQQLCARTGKRLPTNDEWYRIVSGFSDYASCNINSQNPEPSAAGVFACVTPSGVHDMIGNVWEWVDAEVINGQYNNRALPQSGYVALVDSDGVVVETSASGNTEFGNDYAWTDHEGVRGMLRGGFYGSKDDAGIFTQNMSVPLDFKTTGVGFRCVRDI